MNELKPYLCVSDSRAAIQWYADVLGAEVTSSGIALDRAAEDTPHGRVAVFRDPFGHRWLINQPGA